MVSQIENSDWLQWIERLVGGQTVTARPLERPPDLSRDLYYCCLDDQPDFLVPARYMNLDDLEDAESCRFLLNPDCELKAPGTPSDVHENGLSNYFACGETAPVHGIAWVHNDPGHAKIPFWLGPALFEVVSDLSPGDEIPSGLPASILFPLSMAHIILPIEHENGCNSEWQNTASRSRNSFRERGFVPLGRLIHPFHLSALRRYYRYHLRTGRFKLGDTQTSLRFIKHNEPVARFFHHNLTGVVSQIAGEALKPSYCYFSSYQGGAELKRHQDREQCEISLTLCIDYSPEPQLATPWPLRLHIEGGEIAVFQGLGDCLLYRGRHLPHSRTRLPEGHSSTSIFFHYVREDFTGPLD